MIKDEVNALTSGEECGPSGTKTKDDHCEFSETRCQYLYHTTVSRLLKKGAINRQNGECLIHIELTN